MSKKSFSVEPFSAGTSQIDDINTDTSQNADTSRNVDTDRNVDTSQNVDSTVRQIKEAMRDACSKTIKESRTYPKAERLKEVFTERLRFLQSEGFIDGFNDIQVTEGSTKGDFDVTFYLPLPLPLDFYVNPPSDPYPDKVSCTLKTNLPTTLGYESWEEELFDIIIE